MEKSRNQGFTLLELMVTLGLAAIMVGLTTPNIRLFMLNNRLTTAGNDLLRGIQVARSEAIKRQPQPGTSPMVTICSTNTIEGVADNALACSNGAFKSWFVFADQDGDGFHDGAEPVLAKGAAHSSLTVRSDNAGILCFGPTGFAGVDCNGQVPTRNVVVCDARVDIAAGTNSTSRRAVLITQTGRARVTRLYTEVSNALALTTVGASCP